MIRKIVVAIMLMSLAGMSYAESTVSFAGKNYRASVGETFSVDIVLSDFQQTRGGGIILQFDPAVLSISDVTIDTGTWAFRKIFGLEGGSNGTIEIWFASWNLVSGNAPVATVTFEPISAGNAPLRLMKSERNPFISGENVPLQVSIKKSVVHVRQ